MRGWGLWEALYCDARREAGGRESSQANTSLLWHCQRAARPKTQPSNAQTLARRQKARTHTHKHTQMARVHAHTRALSWFELLNAICCLEVDKKIVSNPAAAHISHSLLRAICWWDIQNENETENMKERHKDRERSAKGMWTALWEKPRIQSVQGEEGDSIISLYSLRIKSLKKKLSHHWFLFHWFLEERWATKGEARLSLLSR